MSFFSERARRVMHFSYVHAVHARWLPAWLAAEMYRRRTAAIQYAAIPPYSILVLLVQLYAVQLYRSCTGTAVHEA